MSIDSFLGTFEVISGKLRVTDPCYTKDTWCSGVLDNVAIGKWSAYTEISDAGSWGKRVATLTVMHESISNTRNWSLTDIDVGVDSGQAGFFDESFYPEGKVGEYDDLDSFYGQVFQMTLSENRAGVIPFGAVSRSGYGDGSYNCFVCRNDDGLVVAAKIEFITDEEYEEDYYDEEEEE